MRRLLLGAVLLILACEGAATLPAPSQRAVTPLPNIDVSDMMGAFPAATFFVVTDDGVKAIALLNHATKYTIPTTGAVQVATAVAPPLTPSAGWVYVADEIAEGTRLRWIDAVNGQVLATWTERSRKLVATGIGHGALAVEPTTGRVLALYSADGGGRIVEAYDPHTLRPLGKRLEMTCGDRLLAAADRIVVPCFADGTLVITDGVDPRVVQAGLGTLIAAAMSVDGTTLVGRHDGTLARLRPAAVTVEKIEPFRPATLAPDGIASPESQSFAIAILTTDSGLGISDLRSGRRYISFSARSPDSPVGGILAQGQFAFWSTGREARHIDLQHGFAETMATFSGTLALPGAVGQ
jgi:hypothetical protein